MRRFVLAALLVLGVPTAHATLLQRFEIEDLARHADVVAVVRVAETTAAWDGDTIRTRVRLDVERVLSGAASRELTVVMPGGTVDGTTATLAGAPRFARGQRMVVFLEARRFGGGMNVVGLAQGAFRLETEAETGMPVAVRDAMTGASFVDAPEDDGARAMYLDEIEARVKAVRP